LEVARGAKEDNEEMVSILKKFLYNPLRIEAMSEPSCEVNCFQTLCMKP
jgi:hypothetical protein